MQEMKEFLHSSEVQQDEARQKRRYEKPELGTVTLFADQVLGACLNSAPPCDGPVPDTAAGS